MSMDMMKYTTLVQNITEQMNNNGYSLISLSNFDQGSRRISSFGVKSNGVTHQFLFEFDEHLKIISSHITGSKSKHKFESINIHFLEKTKKAFENQDSFSKP